MASERTICYGHDAPLPAHTALYAGPLRLMYEDGRIRYIKLGENDAVHQICAAIRDIHWNTVPGIISPEHISTTTDSFEVSFQMDHKQADVDFSWQALIRGAPDGTITYEMQGVANKTFQRNRIGLCVLHPASLAGKPFRVEHSNGDMQSLRFPVTIASYKPAQDLRAISYEIAMGVELCVLFEGEIFEMEDQRNWTDASFKTYGTPIALPFPVTVEAGTSIWQRITVTLHGVLPPTLTVAEQEKVFFTVGRRVLTRPQIGLSMAEHGMPLTELQRKRLRALRLNHLRIELRLYEDDFPGRLQRADHEAQWLATQLELVLIVTDEADNQLIEFRRQLNDVSSSVARIIVFHRDEEATAGHWAITARQILGRSDLSIGTGAYEGFAELNLHPPEVDDVEFVTYALNPQTHAVDNRSLIETLPIQAATVRSAKALYPKMHVVVGPVTLEKRLKSAAAIGTDLRLFSLFGAVWTVGSIKYLAQAGASSLSYFETSGLRGIMASEENLQLNDAHITQPDCVYPVYHLFADLADFSEIVVSTSSSPLAVEGLVLKHENRLRILLVNFTEIAQTAQIRGLLGEGQLSTITVQNAMEAIAKPEIFRRYDPTVVKIGNPPFDITIAPLALMRLDTELT